MRQQLQHVRRLPQPAVEAARDVLVQLAGQGVRGRVGAAAVLVAVARLRVAKASNYESQDIMHNKRMA